MDRKYYGHLINGLQILRQLRKQWQNFEIKLIKK